MKRYLLITANVGSLFEAEQRLQQPWLDEMAEKINGETAEMVILHMQETGGKNYVECSWQVPLLVEELAKRLPDYPIIRAYLDIDHTVCEYTALGVVVFVRESSAESIMQFNFRTHEFKQLERGHVLLHEHLDAYPELIKRKFPKELWAAVKCRKGYMHTRFKINNEPIDFVNAHLFHDESNLAIHDDATIYSSIRKKALDFVLKEVTQCENGFRPLLFVFGDLNFRLNCATFVNKLTEKTEQKHIDDQAQPSSCSDLTQANNTLHADPHTMRKVLSAIEFRRDCEGEDEECVLRIEKKRFDYFNHNQLITEWSAYLDDDREPHSFNELHELPISFPPTYPWSEDPEMADEMMKTRPPAWCDRVLMNERAYNLVTAGLPTYTSLGRNICTGDHKPVSLSFSYAV